MDENNNLSDGFSGSLSDNSQHTNRHSTSNDAENNVSSSVGVGAGVGNIPSNAADNVEDIASNIAINRTAIEDVSDAHGNIAGNIANDDTTNIANNTKNDIAYKSTDGAVDNTDSNTDTLPFVFERKPISNCYVFAKVMHDRNDLCKRIIELALDTEIESIEEICEESEQTTLVTRAVRFDVYLLADNLHIVVEMQTSPEPYLKKRSRYYHSWLDRRILKKGDDFHALSDTYVIFICKFDPVGKHEPIYDVYRCATPRGKQDYVSFSDGVKTVILNTKANLENTTEEVKELLEYIETGICTKDSGLTWELERAIDKAYEDEKWVKDMGIYEITTATKEHDIADAARAEGRAEGQSAERAREAALLEAMSEQGRDTSEFVNAVANGNLDELYREYGIE